MADTNHIGTMVSDDLLAEIDKVAARERRSRAEIIRFACEEYTRKHNRELPVLSFDEHADA